MACHARRASAALAMCLLMAAGCDREERVELDFGKRTAARARSGDGRPRLTVGVGAMLGPEETYLSHAAFLQYLAAAVGREARLVQKRTYLEMNHLLVTGEVDVAFICTGAYLAIEDRVTLLAVPLIRDEPYYHSVIIASRPGPTTLTELRGGHFAFTDPLSNTGRSYAIYLVRARFGTSADEFFGQTTYSGAHDESVRLVRERLVDGAAVDEHVLQRLLARHPEWRRSIEVIDRSPPFGAPPFVARADLPPALVEELRQALLVSHRDAHGRRLLRALGAEGFVESTDYRLAREAAAAARIEPSSTASPDTPSLEARPEVP